MFSTLWSGWISLEKWRKHVALGNDSLVTLSTTMWGILFDTQDIYSDRHEALIVIKLYGWEIELSELQYLLCCCYFECDILVIWHPLVTVVASLLMYSRLLCGRGFEGRAATQRRGRRRDLSFKCSCKVGLFLKTPDCSFKWNMCWSFIIK